MKILTAEQKAKEVREKIISQNKGYGDIESQICSLMFFEENYESFSSDRMKSEVPDFEEFITEKEKLQELIEKLKKEMLEEANLNHTNVNAYKVAEVLKLLKVEAQKEIDSKVIFFMAFNLEDATLTYNAEAALKIVALLDVNTKNLVN